MQNEETQSGQAPTIVAVQPQQVPDWLAGLDEPAEEQPPAHAPKYGVEQVWGPKLGKSFTAVSNFFLANAHRLANGNGLTPTEMLVVIQILSFKWSSQAPFPSLRSIATRMHLSVRTVRDTVRRLEGLGLVQRELNPNGGRSRYHFEGLFKQLEALMAQDIAAKDASEVKAAA